MWRCARVWQYRVLTQHPLHGDAIARAAEHTQRGCAPRRRPSPGWGPNSLQYPSLSPVSLQATEDRSPRRHTNASFSIVYTVSLVEHWGVVVRCVCGTVPVWLVVNVTGAECCSRQEQPCFTRSGWVSASSYCCAHPAVCLAQHICADTTGPDARPPRRRLPTLPVLARQLHTLADHITALHNY